MLHAGLDLSRKRLDVCLITEERQRPLGGRMLARPRTAAPNAAPFSEQTRCTVCECSTLTDPKPGAAGGTNSRAEGATANVAGTLADLEVRRIAQRGR